MNDEHTSAAEQAAAAAPEGLGYTAVRYFAGLIAILYGMARLTGAQFTVLESELDKPMGEVSGFWLTWYYFGYSALYGSFLAWVQIVSGLMLTHERWALLGALFLLPVSVNIVLVDISYGVDFGGVLAATLLLACVVMVVGAHRSRLRNALLLPRDNGDRGPALAVGAAARLVLLVACASLGYWVANFNNRAPTPIDGTWDVVATGGNVGRVETIFFERNRAHLAVFKEGAGRYIWHYFEVDARSDEVTIWEEWLEKGTQHYSGTYNTDTGQMWLNPGPEAAGAAIQLQRR